MRLLTASTLALVLSSSTLVAFDILPPVAGPARLAPPLHREQPAPDFSALFKPVAESGIGSFVPNENGPPTVGEITEASGQETICEAVASAAAANDLPLAFFLRLIWQESRFDPLAISRAGAQGVAQFMPRVAAAMGLEDPFDPSQALPKSARFLKALREQFGNLGLAAAAYNAGSGRIQNWLAKGGRLPKETRDYVTNITGHAPERWIKTAPGGISMKVPSRLPCRMPEAAMEAAIPMPPERPQEGLLRVMAFGGPENEGIATSRNSPFRAMAARASHVSARTRTSRLLRAKTSTAMMVVHKISGKGSKISTSTHQQRAVIFVNRKPDASRVKVAQKKAPAGRVQTKLAGKAMAGRTKVADKGGPRKAAPQRVHVAFAGRR